MPLVKIQTNQHVTDDGTFNILQEASKLVADKLGKPESYVMISFEPAQAMLFAGSNEPLAYIELKSIGLQESQTAALSASLSQLINVHIKIPKERIYIEFTDALPKMWGWNGGTF